MTYRTKSFISRMLSITALVFTFSFGGAFEAGSISLTSFLLTISGSIFLVGYFAMAAAQFDKAIRHRTSRMAHRVSQRTITPLLPHSQKAFTTAHRAKSTRPSRAA